MADEVEEIQRGRAGAPPGERGRAKEVSTHKYRKKRRTGIEAFRFSFGCRVSPSRCSRVQDRIGHGWRSLQATAWSSNVFLEGMIAAPLHRSWG